MKTNFSLAPLRARTAAALFIVVYAIGWMRADVVFAWNEVLLQLAADPSMTLPPHVEARVFALSHWAMNDAVDAATESGRSVDAQLAAQRAAAISAAHAVLVQLWPAAAPALNALAQKHLAALPDTADTSRAVAAGRLVAARLLQERQNDGWMDVAVFERAPPDAAALTEKVAQGETPPPSPWLRVKPFCLKSVAQFEVPELRLVTRTGDTSTNPVLEFSTLFKGLDAVGAREGLDEVWSQRPLIVWNRIARQLGAARQLDLRQQARVLAALNVALADATISNLHWRHTVGTWRSMMGEVYEPLNGVPARAADLVVAANTDPFTVEYVRVESQRILIPPTPNHPALPAALAGAAAATLGQFFGAEGFALPATSQRPESPSRTRAFPSVVAAARECTFAASLAGPYSRQACVAGYSLGSSIGRYVAKHAPSARR